MALSVTLPISHSLSLSSLLGYPSHSSHSFFLLLPFTHSLSLILVLTRRTSHSLVRYLSLSSLLIVSLSRCLPHSLSLSLNVSFPSSRNGLPSSYLSLVVSLFLTRHPSNSLSLPLPLVHSFSSKHIHSPSYCLVVPLTRLSCMLSQSLFLTRRHPTSLVVSRSLF